MSPTIQNTSEHHQSLPDLSEHHDEHCQTQSVCQSGLDHATCPHVAYHRRAAHKHKQAGPQKLCQTGLHVLLEYAPLLVHLAGAFLCRLLPHLTHREHLRLSAFCPRHDDLEMNSGFSFLSHFLRSWTASLHWTVWGMYTHYIVHSWDDASRTYAHPVIFLPPLPHLPAIVYTPQTAGIQSVEGHRIISAVREQEHTDVKMRVSSLVTQQGVYCKAEQTQGKLQSQIKLTIYCGLVKMSKASPIRRACSSLKIKHNTQNMLLSRRCVTTI